MKTKKKFNLQKIEPFDGMTRQTAAAMSKNTV